MKHGSKWDERFTRVAYEVASWSKDPREQVGAVLVSPDGRGVSWGYNGFPVDVCDDERLQDADVRRQLSVHAEVNALANCSTRPCGWHLFVTKFPCAPCAAVLVQFGVARVVAPPPSGVVWVESQGLARVLLNETGVEMSILEELP